MGRPRSFDEDTILEAAAGVFVRGGYEGTSIDDLVRTLGLHRGSLYLAFGSKRGLFLAALRRYVQTDLAALALDPRTHGDEHSPSNALARSTALDLLLIAALERGPLDAEVAALVRQAIAMLEHVVDHQADRPKPSDPASPLTRVFTLLGARLYERLHNPPGDQPGLL